MAELADEALAPPAAEADAATGSPEPAGSVQQDESDEDYSEGSSGEEEEESGEEEEQGSSGDEDEKRPLSQRSAYTAKHPLPQPTAPKRTRTNRFPKIPKSQRCGACENCLNPQRKKACTVARQRMEEQMRLKEQRQGNGSSSGSGGGGDRVAAAPGPDPADDPFTASLAKILSSTGGVQQERHVALLLQLVRRARSKAHRTALLVVLQRSAAEVQRQAVAGRLLLELQGWLSDAVAEGDAKRAQNCLACLDKLPVTLAALQPPCELGKVVGKLRKHDSFGPAITDTAKRLVARWKGLVEAAQAKKAASGAPGASTASAAAAAAKPAAPKPAAPKPAAVAAAGKPAPAAKPAAASTAIQDRQASGSLAGMADGDLFKSADRQRAGVRDAVPAVKKTVIKTLPVEASRARLSEAAAADKEGGGKASSSAAAAADVSKVSASPFAALGGLGAGVTMLGGSGGSGPLGSISLSTVGPSSNSARERALAAARRVPSPERQTRKEKAKKVSWQKEDALVGVRWFLKADPPAAAGSDADPAQLQRSVSDAAREPSPPGFESAAKKEHLSEAAALRQHRAEEGQERADLEERLSHMVATTAWLNPQPNEDLSDAKLAAMPAPPAYGEDSTEAPAAAARSQQVPRAQYASAAAVPDTPAEPNLIADHGVVQHPATIPRIPLSLEEAAAMQPQQAQQQQPSQQPMQQPMQQPGPQPMYRQQPPAAQQQQQQQQQGQPAAAGMPDISAALAQLAASGVLSAVTGGAAPQQQQQQQPTMQQQQYPGQSGMPPHMRPPPPPMGGPRPPPPGGLPQQGWQQPGPPRPPMQQTGPPRPPMQQAGMQQPRPPMQQPGPPRPPMQQPGPPRPPMQQPGPPMQGAPMQQRSFGPRPCRYFNTPRGCFQGDRCNFAHVPLGGPGAGENGRGPGPAAGMKRPAESDAGRQSKQLRWQ